LAPKACSLSSRGPSWSACWTHLDGEKACAGAANSRNGHTEKALHTELGDVRIRVPRDREGTFEPQVVKKHQKQQSRSMPLD